MKHDNCANCGADHPERDEPMICELCTGHMTEAQQAAVLTAYMAEVRRAQRARSRMAGRHLERLLSVLCVAGTAEVSLRVVVRHGEFSGEFLGAKHGELIETLDGSNLSAVQPERGPSLAQRPRPRALYAGARRAAKLESDLAARRRHTMAINTEAMRSLAAEVMEMDPNAVIDFDRMRWNRSEDLDMPEDLLDALFCPRVINMHLPEPYLEYVDNDWLTPAMLAQVLQAVATEIDHGWGPRVTRDSIHNDWIDATLNLGDAAVFNPEGLTDEDDE